MIYGAASWRSGGKAKALSAAISTCRRRLRRAAVSPRSRTAARGCSSMSEAAMKLAQAGLLAPAGLDPGRLGKALDLVLGAQVDAADLYFQVSHEESWALEDGIVKEGSASIGQ